MGITIADGVVILRREALTVILSPPPVVILSEAKDLLSRSGAKSGC